MGSIFTLEGNTVLHFGKPVFDINFNTTDTNAKDLALAILALASEAIELDKFGDVA